MTIKIPDDFDVSDVEVRITRSDNNDSLQGLINCLNNIQKDLNNVDDYLTSELDRLDLENKIYSPIF